MSFTGRCALIQLVQNMSLPIDVWWVFKCLLDQTLFFIGLVVPPIRTTALSCSLFVPFFIFFFFLFRPLFFSSTSSPNVSVRSPHAQRSSSSCPNSVRDSMTSTRDQRPFCPDILSHCSTKHAEHLYTTINWTTFDQSTSSLGRSLCPLAKQWLHLNHALSGRALAYNFSNYRKRGHENSTGPAVAHSSPLKAAFFGTRCE